MARYFLDVLSYVICGNAHLFQDAKLLSRQFRAFENSRMLDRREQSKCWAAFGGLRTRMRRAVCGIYASPPEFCSKPLYWVVSIQLHFAMDLLRGCQAGHTCLYEFVHTLKSFSVP